MIRGLYAAGTGLNAMSVNQDVTARNIAHANKPGFLRRIARFESVGSKEDILGTAPSVYTDYSTGPPIHTGTPTDVAVIDKGFFELEGPDGPLYTRSGVFHVNGDGILMNFDGMPVLGDPPGTLPGSAAQRIILPQNTRNIDILDNGAVLSNGNEVGRMHVATFDEPSAQLIRRGTTLYEPRSGIDPTYNEANVRQGYRNGSNTSIVTELIHMTFGLRQFEASQRAIRTLDEMIGQNTNPQQR